MIDSWGTVHSTAQKLILQYPYTSVAPRTYIQKLTQDLSPVFRRKRYRGSQTRCWVT